MPQTTVLEGATSGEVRISADGTRIYQAGADGIVRVYDTLTGALVSEWDIGGDLGAMDISPDGGTMVILDTQTAVMYYVDLLSFGQFTTVPYSLEAGRGVYVDIAILPDSTALMIQSRTNGSIPLLTRVNLNSLESVTIDSVFPDSVLSRASNVGGGNAQVLVTELTGFASVFTSFGNAGDYQTSGLSGDSPVAQAISDDFVAVGSNQDGLRIFTTGVNPITGIASDVVGTVRELEFSADGEFLYALGNNGATLFTIRTSDWSVADSFATGLQLPESQTTPVTLLVDPRGQFLTVQAGSTFTVLENPFAPSITGDEFPNTIVGTLFGDVIDALGGNDEIDAGGGVDIIYGGAGYNRIEGGADVDTLVVSGNFADYTITQGVTGRFEISDGGDVNFSGSLDDVTGVEFVQFADQTIRLLRGTGVSVNFETADPNIYQSAMDAIRDFDGNALGGDGAWLRIGSADINGDGDVDQILVNDAIGRFATVGTAPDGLTYFEDYSWAGETRVAGIYIDPLVESGDVVAGSDNDSQRRFQNDLQIENINRVLGADDYDGDGVWEVYFALTDGTAYLRALMHEDGNIRYANYQSEQEVIDYLTANGYDESTFGDWFPAATSAADTLTFVNEAPKFAEIETFERPAEFHSRPVDEWQVEYFG